MSTELHPRRRTCYIAPERFRTRNIHSTSSGTNLATDVTDSTASSSSATTSAYDAVVQGLDSVVKIMACNLDYAKGFSIYYDHTF